MSKHTPGPWFRNIRAGGKYPVIFAGRNTHVAQACQMPEPSETEANIDLIAAAPQMLEALKRAEAYQRLVVATHGTQTAIEALENIRAAIAAAEGEV